MAVIMNKVVCEINPLQPVPELIAVISAVMPYNVGNETVILEALRDEIDAALKREQQKGVE